MPKGTYNWNSKNAWYALGGALIGVAPILEIIRYVLFYLYECSVHSKTITCTLSQAKHKSPKVHGRHSKHRGVSEGSYPATPDREDQGGGRSVVHLRSIPSTLS